MPPLYELGLAHDIFPHGQQEVLAFNKVLLVRRPELVEESSLINLAVEPPQRFLTFVVHNFLGAVAVHLEHFICFVLIICFLYILDLDILVYQHMRPGRQEIGPGLWVLWELQSVDLPEVSRGRPHQGGLMEAYRYPTFGEVYSSGMESC